MAIRSAASQAEIHELGIVRPGREANLPASALSWCSRDEIDDPGDGVRSVEAGSGAVDDLDPLDLRQVELSTTVEPPGVELVHLDTIDQHENLVVLTGHASQKDVAVEAFDVTELESRQVGERILERQIPSLLDLRRGDHANGSGHLVDGDRLLEHRLHTEIHEVGEGYLEDLLQVRLLFLGTPRRDGTQGQQE